MGQLILEYPVEARQRDKGRLTVDLGNGVRLIADIPEWAGEVRSSKLQIILFVDGSPPDDQSSTTSIERVHKTPSDG